MAAIVLDGKALATQVEQQLAQRVEVIKQKTNGITPILATILVGAATPAEIEESVAAVKAGPLPSELHQAVEDLGLP